LLNQDNHFLRQSPSQSLTENEDIFLRQGLRIEENSDLSSLKRLSPVALAYIGDAVYELFMRTRFLFPPKHISDYHKKVVDEVRAETQASYLQILEPYLTKTEKEIVRRGRNAVSKSPRRLSLEVYQKATSLETLIGYLYLQNSQRLDDLFSLIVDS
jgi:ribonuclease-3 family protein